MVAKWFLGEKVSRHSVGPCSTTATDTHILAFTTIVFITFKVSELKEKIRFLPDFLKRSLFDISGGFGKITAGEDLSIHIDKADQLTGKAPF